MPKALQGPGPPLSVHGHKKLKIFSKHMFTYRKVLVNSFYFTNTVVVNSFYFTNIVLVNNLYLKNNMLYPKLGKLANNYKQDQRSIAQTSDSSQSVSQ